MITVGLPFLNPDVLAKESECCQKEILYGVQSNERVTTVRVGVAPCNVFLLWHRSCSLQYLYSLAKSVKSRVRNPPVGHPCIEKGCPDGTNTVLGISCVVSGRKISHFILSHRVCSYITILS